MEKRVFTHEAHQKSELKRLEGVRQIEESFKKVRQVVPGMVKPDSSGQVTAKRVMNVFPLWPALAKKLIQVINDDENAAHENMTLSGATKSEFALSQMS